MRNDSFPAFMNASLIFMPSHHAPIPALGRAARFPGLRSLAWSGDQLYASREYQLLRSSIVDVSSGLAWKPVAAFRPTWQRRLSVTNRMSARLFRDGFQALAVLASRGIVAAVAGSIVMLRAGDNEFRATHVIARCTRPLHAPAARARCTRPLHAPAAHHCCSRRHCLLGKILR
jgi:hypothetical protein